MTQTRIKNLKLIVVGSSLGGLKALTEVLSPLPTDFSVPILVVQHQAGNSDGYLSQILGQKCLLKIKFAATGDLPTPGNVYIAPPDRHLLVGRKGELQLSKAKPVNYSRPAIDPLFISAAKRHGESVLAVLLTGANNDGTAGVIEVKKRGGQVLVQDPDSAEADVMPKSAIAAVKTDYIVWLDQIGPQLWDITR